MSIVSRELRIQLVSFTEPQVVLIPCLLVFSRRPVSHSCLLTPVTLLALILLPLLTSNLLALLQTLPMTHPAASLVIPAWKAAYAIIRTQRRTEVATISPAVLIRHGRMSLARNNAVGSAPGAPQDSYVSNMFQWARISRTSYSVTVIRSGHAVKPRPDMWTVRVLPYSHSKPRHQINSP